MTCMMQKYLLRPSLPSELAAAFLYMTRNVDL